MKKLMLGNEAIARGIWEAGATVVSSYPGTPSTEITEFVAKYDDIYSEWAPNEKVAMEVAIGAAVSGARSACAMKHVGVNVAADPLFTAAYTGVNGGMLVLVADDQGMHSSQNEQDSRYYARSAHIPMLEPADSRECKEFVKLGYALSEQYDTPVFIRLTTRIAHSQSIVDLNEKADYRLKPYEKDMMKYVMMPGMAKKRHQVVEQRELRLAEDANTMAVNRVEPGSSDVGIIAAGIAYQYAKDAFPEASFLKLGMVYPLPMKLIQEFADTVKTLYVVEELEPFFEEQIKAAGIEVIGKDRLTLQGEYSVGMLKERLGNLPPREREEAVSLPARPPVMCPGCPHRGTFYVLKKLGLTVCGDIGCYTLGALAPNSAMDTCICMGASIGVAHGMDKARGTDFAKKTVAVIGDSTFMHSGITGLIDMVYNKGVSTVLILDNSITGMTGHQENPTTGRTIKGHPTKQVDLLKLAHAVGVDRVVVADPFDLKSFEKVVKEEIQAEEPSVIIAQRPCALLKGVKFDGIQQIIQDKCRKCRMCLKIGCPAIVEKEDRIEINPALCVGCRLCNKLCGFGAIERTGE